ncbi:MAG: hypothetical protein M3P18_15090, partial [Actinomycetota bacterium]|nr:hypothetical protein [Actinomycetota bacterium]
MRSSLDPIARTPLTSQAFGVPALLVGGHEAPAVDGSRVGIDYLGISTPVVRRDPRPALWDSIHRERFEAWVSVGKTKILVSSFRDPTGRLWGALNFNPSRIAYDSPMSICTVADLPDAIDQAWAQLSLRVDAVDPDWRAARVRRIDLARDFDVSDPGRVLDALVRIPRERAK